MLYKSMKSQGKGNGIKIGLIKISIEIMGIRKICFWVHGYRYIKDNGKR